MRRAIAILLGALFFGSGCAGPLGRFQTWGMPGTPAFHVKLTDKRRLLIESRVWENGTHRLIKKRQFDLTTEQFESLKGLWLKVAASSEKTIPNNTVLDGSSWCIEFRSDGKLLTQNSRHISSEELGSAGLLMVKINGFLPPDEPIY